MTTTLNYCTRKDGSGDADAGETKKVYLVPFLGMRVSNPSRITVNADRQTERVDWPRFEQARWGTPESRISAQPTEVRAQLELNSEPNTLVVKTGEKFSNPTTKHLRESRSTGHSLRPA